MKKFALIAALGLCFALAGTHTADAKDMSGRFGVGADSTFGWGTGLAATGQGQSVPNKGLSIVYAVSKAFGIQLILGAGFGSGSEDIAGTTVDYSANSFGAALRGIIPVAFTNEVNLSAVVGFSFVSASFTVDPTGDDNSASFVSFDLGLRPEWFITEHFSIHTQVGIAISLLSEGTGGLGAPFMEGSDGSGIAFDLFQNADLLGEAGFTFWF